MILETNTPRKPVLSSHAQSSDSIVCASLSSFRDDHSWQSLTGTHCPLLPAGSRKSDCPINWSAKSYARARHWLRDGGGLRFLKTCSQPMLTTGPSRQNGTCPVRGSRRKPYIKTGQTDAMGITTALTPSCGAEAHDYHAAPAKAPSIVRREGAPIGCWTGWTDTRD